MTVDEFEIRRTTHSSNPWRVFHAPTDREVSIPSSLENADGKVVTYRGPACFARKRDAAAWMRDVLPSLLTERTA